MDKVLKFLLKYNIKAKNKDLFLEALTHPSFANEKSKCRSYQRLEFLGDSILSKLSAEKTFHLYPNASEGNMTIIRSNSINGKQLATFAKEIGMDELVRLGKNNEHLRNSEKILEDIFEALVAAIYLDQGEDITKMFLKNNVFNFIEKSKNKNLKNPKTLLQEYLQAESREIIKYRTKKSKKGFVSEIFHDGNYFGKGEAETKKEAEIQAAKEALKILGEKE